ncbi:MAG: aminotransferase class V-fold PLP-dependent enzyme, partial [bacterium]
EWQPGDRIVTLAGEFPNYLYLPALVSRWGVEVIEAPWERFYQTIDQRTRLVALSSVNYTNGFLVPLVDIGRFLRDRGVPLFVDGTQSVGALRFDVAESGCDALAVHGYKWLLSPTGAGFLYLRRQLRDRLRPNVVGWRSHTGWRDVHDLHHGKPEFDESAQKFEGAMLPFPELYALGASVEMLLEIGTDQIERRVLQLAGRTRALLAAAGGEVATGGAQIVAARFPRLDVPRLAQDLRDRGVLVSARHGNLRVSPHFYNNEQDLEKFAAALRELLSNDCPDT